MSTTDPRSRVTVAYADFMLALEAAGRATGTLRYYREKLEPFFAFLKARQIDQVDAITPAILREYLLQRQKEVEALTVLHHAACIRAWLNHLVNEGVVTGSPLRTVKLPRPEEKLQPALTATEAAAIIKAADSPRNRAIILTLLDTGLRASEFVAVNRADLDLSTGAILVRHTKTRQQRMVYVGAKTRRALTLYLAAAPVTEHLWQDVNGERLTVNALRLLCKRLARRTGIKACHPHTFRRTFALWSLRAGMNIYVLARLMGHRDLTMLKRYLALVETDLAAAHQAHGAVDRTL